MHVPGSTPVFTPTFKATVFKPGNVIRHIDCLFCAAVIQLCILCSLFNSERA